MEVEIGCAIYLAHAALAGFGFNSIAGADHGAGGQNTRRKIGGGIDADIASEQVVDNLLSAGVTV